VEAKGSESENTLHEAKEPEGHEPPHLEHQEAMLELARKPYFWAHLSGRAFRLKKLNAADGEPKSAVS
jgi:hypothetical protein